MSGNKKIIKVLSTCKNSHHKRMWMSLSECQHQLDNYN